MGGAENMKIDWKDKAWPFSLPGANLRVSHILSCASHYLSPINELLPIQCHAHDFVP
jgi:hypothetical protein